jgi:glutaminase
MQEKQPIDALGALVGDLKAVVSPLRKYLGELYNKYKSETAGKPADYIPELAKANPADFGICITTLDGRNFAFGDVDQVFTIQSISKPFVYGLALEDHGREYVSSKVGVEPTGDAFNSLIRLDDKSKRPFNPMINAGAIATTALIKGRDETERFNRLLDVYRRLTGRDILVDMSVFTSERSTGHRNRAIAHLMLNFNMIHDLVDETLDLYFKQCSLLVTCRDLAMMGATMANAGVNPVTGEQAIASEYVQDILSVMYTCGMYNFSGEWAYRVGLAAKSGVGGGICAVVPGLAGIGVYSPPLDEHGNSVRGIGVIEELSKRYNLHTFSGQTGYPKFREALSDSSASGNQRNSRSANAPNKPVNS